MGIYLPHVLHLIHVFAVERVGRYGTENHDQMDIYSHEHKIDMFKCSIITKRGFWNPTPVNFLKKKQHSKHPQLGYLKDLKF